MGTVVSIDVRRADPDAAEAALDAAIAVLRAADERFSPFRPDSELSRLDRGELADDELSIAALLDGMATYVRGGAPVYSVAEACQDQYLQLEIRRAIDSGSTISTSTQPWAVR